MCQGHQVIRRCLDHEAKKKKEGIVYKPPTTVMICKDTASCKGQCMYDKTMSKQSHGLQFSMYGIYLGQEPDDNGHRHLMFKGRKVALVPDDGSFENDIMFEHVLQILRANPKYKETFNFMYLCEEITKRFYFWGDYKRIIGLRDAAATAVASSTINTTNRSTGAPSIRAPSNAATTTHAPIPEAVLPSQLIQLVATVAESTKVLSESVMNDRNQNKKKEEDQKKEWNQRYNQLMDLVQGIGSGMIRLDGEVVRLDGRVDKTNENVTAIGQRVAFVENTTRKILNALNNGTIQQTDFAPQALDNAFESVADGILHEDEQLASPVQKLNPQPIAVTPFLEQQRKETIKLQRKQKLALHLYTRNGLYKQINNTLRGRPRPEDVKNKKKIEEKIELLEGAFATRLLDLDPSSHLKPHKSHNGKPAPMLFRGNPSAKRMAERLKLVPGAIFQEPAFLSTSTLRSVAEEFTTQSLIKDGPGLIICISDSFSGMNISNHSNKKDEDEVLFLPRTKFMIDEVKENEKWNEVWMHEIP